jgi:hypothetical protein
VCSIHKCTISPPYTQWQQCSPPPLPNDALYSSHRYTDGIPGKVGLPLLNDDLLVALKRGRNGLALVSHERRKKYGDIYHSRMLGEVVVTVSDLDHVKRILAAEHTLVEGARAPSYPAAVQESVVSMARA